MNQKDTNDEYLEIDLLRLLKAMWHRAWVIVLAALLCGVIAFSYANFVIQPEYTTSAQMYVNNGSLSLGSTTISLSDMNASSTLVSRYIVLIQSRTTLTEVIERLNLPYTPNQLKSMIKASSVNSTEFFNITVTSHDPAEATLIANTMAEVLPTRVEDIMDSSTVKIVDYAIVPSTRSAPNVTRYTAIGLLIGFILSAGVICLLEIFDDQIRGEDYLIQTYSLPILATIPDLTASGKGKGYYKYGYRSHYGYASHYYESAAEGKKS